jgi:hypothetical protein
VIAIAGYLVRRVRPRGVEIDQKSNSGVIPATAGIQYAVPLPYGTMADIRTLKAYWIIRLRG